MGSFTIVRESNYRIVCVTAETYDSMTYLPRLFRQDFAVVAGRQGVQGSYKVRWGFTVWCAVPSS